MTLPKLLIIGDAVAPTGFARVIRSIFGPLAADFELHQLATRYNGGPHDYPWKLYRANKDGSVYGYDQVVPLIEEVKPALVFLLYDLSFQVHYLELIRSAATRLAVAPQVVIYSPVEAGPIAPELIHKLGDVSRYVLFTEYGRREIEETLAIIRETQPEFAFPAL